MYLGSRTSFGESAVIPPKLSINVPPPPFPNIQRHSKALYAAALKAQTTFDKIKWFAPLYHQLNQAASLAWLGLDATEEIVVITDEKTTETLLGPKLVKAALKQSGKSLARELVGRDFARALGIVDFLFKLISALSLADRKRLVSEQKHSRRAEADDYKLRYFIQLWIAQHMRLADRARLAGILRANFYTCRKALDELQKYQNIEANLRQGLPAHQRRHQSYNVPHPSHAR